MKIKIDKKIIVRVLLILIIVCLVTIAVTGIDVALNIRKQDRQSALYLFRKIDFRKLSRVESDYLTLGWDIIDRFSAKSTRYSMTKEQRIKFLTENKRLAYAFGFGYYDAMIIGILESGLNPHLSHEPYNEVGMFGHWYSTAAYYYHYAHNYMPKRLFGYVNFDLRKRADLYDPINALKMTYIFLWIESKNYKGDEMWYISGYRWGKFIAQHWHNGTKEFPIRFTIQTRFGIKKYNPRAYYFSWRNMRDCFERGDVDAGIKSYKKWKHKEDNRRIEEVQFVRLYKAFKYKEKELNETKALIKLLQSKVDGIDKQNKIELKAMNKIAVDTKTKGIKSWWPKFVKFCKERILKRGVDKDANRQNFSR